jgi:hypothetical protein
VTLCTTCNRDVEISFGSALVPNGFLLFDSTSGQDVPDLDSCERYLCPHDTRTSCYSRMLPPMGSMGEEAHEFYEDDGECPF